MIEKIYHKLQTREGITLIASIALIVAIVSFVFGGWRHHRMGIGSQPEPSITVTGVGETFAVPDVAMFTFTVTKDAKTMAEAQDQVSELANKVVAQLKSAAIEEKDIKTEGFNAYPKYENRASSISACTPTYCPPYNNNPVIVGYTVSHTYSVKVRNLEKASDIAKLLTDANVSSISGPDFTIADIDSVKDDARGLAIIDAKEQARVIAQQLGVRLGKVIGFDVSSGGSYPMATYKAYSAGMADMAASEPEIAPGESSIKAQVTITYSIR